MKKKIQRKNLYIISGPNGAGKTTFAKEFLPVDAGCLEFVNADLIAGGLSPFAPEWAAFQSGRVMLEGEDMKRGERLPHIPLAYRAEKALKRAVAKALAEHRRNGIPIAIWRNGKVVRIPAEQIEVRQPQVEYGTPRKSRK